MGVAKTGILLLAVAVGIASLLATSRCSPPASNASAESQADAPGDGRNRDRVEALQAPVVPGPESGHRSTADSVASDLVEVPGTALEFQGEVVALALEWGAAEVCASSSRAAQAVFGSTTIDGESSYRLRFRLSELADAGSDGLIELSVRVGGLPIAWASVSLSTGVEQLVEGERVLSFHQDLACDGKCLVSGRTVSSEPVYSTVSVFEVAQGALKPIKTSKTLSDGRFGVLLESAREYLLVAVDEAKGRVPESRRFFTGHESRIDLGDVALRAGESISGVLRLPEALAHADVGAVRLSIRRAARADEVLVEAGNTTVGVSGDRVEYLHKYLVADSRDRSFAFPGLLASSDYQFTWEGFASGGGMMPGIEKHPQILRPSIEATVIPYEALVMIRIAPDSILSGASVTLEKRETGTRGQFYFDPQGRAPVIVESDAEYQVTVLAPDGRVSSRSIRTPSSGGFSEEVFPF